MSTDRTIRYLSRKEIDDQQWDHCIDQAANSLIYGYSYYLDAMALQWDALVLNNYEAVMPLTWNKKYGFYYLYQPAFTASLGIFGRQLTEETIALFLQSIPSRFRLIEISLNKANTLASSPLPLQLRTNYVLDLGQSYEQLRKAYRENHRRNIQRALQTGCSLTQDVPLESIIELNKQLLASLQAPSEADYIRFTNLCNSLNERGEIKRYGVVNAKGQLLASAVFFFSGNRIYYILVGNHPDGKTIGASHLLIDSFIRDHAGQPFILDFEGSDIRSLAFFYSGFGAAAELYPALHINKLPFYIRWFKK